ncbi:hypothetical protein CDD80_3156 [Ophiocordyceps camponoti-rufipedis]|uniref:Uncharacterized protein n=1 Tax=Ophiocordyceps camponoti-rufipedis TaxID=2004952 RepID=A0A2C5Z002_9HYPO|nr:hypothetical protein CDD80_3156 [Ophiocordyceps camponoti-rufipedis]
MRLLLLHLFIVFGASLPTPITTPDAGSRNILIKTLDGRVMVKFRNVPNTYSDLDVKQADLVGTVKEFTNGERWMTLKNRRLFLMPSESTSEEKPTDSISGWPVMSPEELKILLATFPASMYDELFAQLKVVNDKLRDQVERQSSTSQRRRRSAWSPICWPRHENNGRRSIPEAEAHLR